VKRCATCQIAPWWHFSRNVSIGRAEKQNYFQLAGCAHVQAFLRGAADPFIPDRARVTWEAKWDAEAERLFAAYTAKWTAQEREQFAARLWPVPPPVIPAELFARDES
jgi:hypothetical protein